MNRISWSIPLLLLMAWFVMATPAGAKGPAGMITIAVLGLEEPLEITDPAVLNRFDPWSSQFIGTSGPLEWPPDMGLREPYQVFFHLPGNQGEMETRYMFYYYPDPAGGLGTIYLPGSGEPYYRINVGTIIRNGADGRWFKAMPTWDAAFQELLPAPGASASNILQHESAPWLWALSGVALLGVIIAWYIRRAIPIQGFANP